MKKYLWFLHVFLGFLGLSFSLIEDSGFSLYCIAISISALLSLVFIREKNITNN